MGYKFLLNYSNFNKKGFDDLPLYGYYFNKGDDLIV